MGRKRSSKRVQRIRTFRKSNSLITPLAWTCETLAAQAASEQALLAASEKIIMDLQNFYIRGHLKSASIQSAAIKSVTQKFSSPNQNYFPAPSFSFF